MNQELHATRERSDHTAGHLGMLVVSLALLSFFVITTILAANAMETKNNWPVLILIAVDFICFAFVVVSAHRLSQSREEVAASSKEPTFKTEREILQEKRAFWSDLFPGTCIAPFLVMLVGVPILKEKPDWLGAMITLEVLFVAFLVVVLWRHRLAMNALRRLK